MLTAAYLPYLAGLTAVWLGRVRGREWRDTWQTAAAITFFTGLAACAVAMVFADI